MANKFKPSPEQAQKLFERGAIDEKTYRRLVPQQSFAQGGMVQDDVEAYAQQMAQAESVDLSAPLGFAEGGEVSSFDDIGMSGTGAMAPSDQSSMIQQASSEAVIGKQNREADAQADLERRRAAHAKESRRRADLMMKPLPNDPSLTPAPAAPSEGTEPAAQAPSDAGEHNPDLYEPGAPAPEGRMPGMPGASGWAQQQMAVAEAARIGELEAAEAFGAITRTITDDEQRILTNNVHELARQKQLQDSRQKLEKKTDELASLKVDENRYWANASTGNKVAAGIAVFLGAFGRNGNGAAKIIQNSIDQDIEAQKANITAQHSAVSAKRGLYSDMVREFGDTRLAEEATRMAYLNHAQLKLKSIEVKYSGPEAKANAAKLYGELQVKKDEAFSNWEMQWQKLFAAKNPKGNNPALMTKDQLARWVPNWGFATTAENAGKMLEKISQIEVAKSGIKELLTIAKKPAKSLSISERAQAQQISKMLQGSLRLEIVGPGVVTDTDRAILESVIADPTKIFSIDQVSRVSLETLTNRIDKNMRITGKTYGLIPPDEKLGITARGK